MSRIVRPSVFLALLVLALLPATPVQAQITSTVTALGDSCGNPAPRLSITGAVPGGNSVLCVDSAFPGGGPGSMEGHLILFASFPPTLPYPVFPPSFPGPWGPCVVYVDLGALTFFQETQTDAQGDWCGLFPIPPEPSLAGQVVNLQARLWAAGGPYEGGDHLSNGIQLRFGDTNVSGEGKTPGFWKQPQHFKFWTAPYTPSTLFSSVFDNAFPGRTLLQVLQAGGGGINALGRHTVAALLNAANPNYQYPLTTSQIITLFNGAVPGPAAGIENLKNYFDANNNAGES